MKLIYGKFRLNALSSICFLLLQIPLFHCLACTSKRQYLLFNLPLVSLKKTVTLVGQHWVSLVTMICIQSIFVDWMNPLLNIAIQNRILTDDFELQQERIRLNLVRKLAWQTLKYKLWVMIIKSSLPVISWIPESSHPSCMCGPAWQMTSSLWPSEFLFGCLILDLLLGFLDWF